jgi:hypothetical protein
MPKLVLEGPTYDHSWHTFMKVCFIFLCVCMATILAMLGYVAFHDHQQISAVPMFPLAMSMPLLAIGLAPRWQLAADGLWDLRGKSKKKGALAPYSDIHSVRLLKTKKNGAKTFEIVTGKRTAKVDVLQGEAFESELRNRIGSDKFSA